MTDETLQELNDRLAAVEKKVDALNARIEPFLQGVTGLSLVWKVLIALGGAVLLFQQIKQSL